MYNKLNYYSSTPVPIETHSLTRLNSQSLTKQILRPKTYVKSFIQSRLESADIKVGGNRPWDIQVENEDFYSEVFWRQSLGLGESYMKGYWNCQQLDQLICKIFSSPINRRRNTPANIASETIARFFNLQSKGRAKIVNTKHYDLGNELYREMLDENMLYTCAYWKNATTLEEAQINKMKLICEKLELQPGMTLLDIGCGFGSLMKFAAENYGVKCVGYSLSTEQIKFGRESCQNLDIEFVYDDYRNIKGKFDRVVSVGMLEAVGAKNFRTYMEVVYRSLKDNGLALIHSVGHNRTTFSTDPWVDRYIFPNGVLPSIKQIGESIENLFVMEDWHNFGPDYDRTLMEWNRRFQKNWPRLSSKLSPEFKKMWEFYLLSFAGGFRARNWQLWQVVLSKQGRKQPQCLRQN